MTTPRPLGRVAFEFGFDDGAQNESGKVAVKGDSFAMCQLRQKWAIPLPSNLYHYHVISLISVKYYKLEPPDHEASCNVTPLAAWLRLSLDLSVYFRSCEDIIDKSKKLRRQIFIGGCYPSQFYDRSATLCRWWPSLNTFAFSEILIKSFLF